MRTTGHVMCALAAILWMAAAAGCGSPDGSEYVGRWQVNTAKTSQQGDKAPRRMDDWRDVEYVINADNSMVKIHGEQREEGNWRPGTVDDEGWFTLSTSTDGSIDIREEGDDTIFRIEGKHIIVERVTEA